MLAITAGAIHIFLISSKKQYGNQGPDAGPICDQAMAEFGSARSILFQRRAALFATKQWFVPPFRLRGQFLDCT